MFTDGEYFFENKIKGVNRRKISKAVNRQITFSFLLLDHPFCENSNISQTKIKTYTSAKFHFELLMNYIIINIFLNNVSFQINGLF